MGIKYVSKQQNTVLAVLLALILSLASLFMQPTIVSAQTQACAALPETFGKITLPKATEPVTITQQTEYTVWIRMRVTNLAHKVSVSVDSTNSAANCGVDVGAPTGATVNNWFWSKTKATGGDFNATIPANSNVKVQIAGQSTSPNVDVDLILLISDNCEPQDTTTTFGANCTTPAPTPTPTIAPTVAPSPTVAPTINPEAQLYDLNPNRSINVDDLSLLINDYAIPGQPVVTNSPADFNNSGTVEVRDLSQLIKHWGQTY